MTGNRQLLDEIISKLPHKLMPRAMECLSSLPEGLLLRINTSFDSGETSHNLLIHRAIKERRGETYFSDLLTYEKILRRRDEWALEALDVYRRHPWYPDPSDPSAVPAVSRHIKETEKVIVAVLSYWNEHPLARNESLTHHGFSATNRDIWMLTDDALLRHLFYHPEDADKCRDIANERGTISYEMLHATTHNAVSKGWL